MEWKAHSNCCQKSPESNHLKLATKKKEEEEEAWWGSWKFMIPEKATSQTAKSSGYKFAMEQQKHQKV
jgi:hypothetical protein